MKRVQILSLTTLSAAIFAGSTLRADVVQPIHSDANDGTVTRLAPGETFTTSAASEFGAALVNNGTVRGPLAAGEFLTFTDRVSGAGGYFGNISFDGRFSPGNSPAVVTFEGDLSFGSANILLIELGGTALGQFDRLVVDGNVSLAGSLEVELINSFTLSPSQSFEIIDVGDALSGQFAGLSEGGLVGNFSGTDLFITYAAGAGNNNVALFTAIPESNWIAALGVVSASLCGWFARRRVNLPA